MVAKAQHRRPAPAHPVLSRLALFALLLSAGASLATTDEEPWADSEDDDWLGGDGEDDAWWVSDERIESAVFSLTPDDGPRRSFLVSVDLTFNSAVMTTTEDARVSVELQVENTEGASSGQGATLRLSRSDRISEAAQSEDIVQVIGLARGERRNDLSYQLDADTQHCQGTSSCALEHRVVLEHLGGGDVEGQWVVSVRMQGRSEGWTDPDTRIRVSEE